MFQLKLRNPAQMAGARKRKTNQTHKKNVLLLNGRKAAINITDNSKFAGKYTLMPGL